MTLRVLGLWVAVSVAAGCGGAAPQMSPGFPAGDDTREPATIDEAQAQLESARRRLEGRSDGAKGVEPGGGAPSQDTDASTKSEEPPRGDSCATSCRAIASMRRAVAAICRMAGDADSRCTDARRVLDENEKRVVRCGCGG